MSMNKREVLVKRNVLSVVPAVLVLCGATALSTNVQAASYAVSTNTITNFKTTFAPSASFSSFTFSSDAATLNNTGTGNAAGMNAAPACVGCTYTDSFVAHGMGSDYSYGDARITNSNVLLGTGQAAAIGESSVSNGLGSGFGINTMVGFFSTSGSTNVGFDFYATPYLLSQISSGGTASVANLNMTVTINDLNTNTTVFSWAPNGQVTAGETLDPFDLNWGIGQTTNGSTSFNPGAGHFAASANLTNAGVYSLNITMKNSVFVQAVPLPAAAWLLGSGLIGMIGIARRQRS